MQSQVKEFFNSLQRKQKKEQNLNPYRNSVRRSRRTVGILPYIEYNVPSITNFSHFMACEIAPNICPLMWEGLELDFENKDRRYCSICEKHVYKVDNQYMLEQLKIENKCMAVSNDLLEKMNGKMEQKRYENLQKRLSISKLFLYEKKYNPEWFYEMQEKSIPYEEQLKKILLNILHHSDFEEYLEFGIDFESIFEIAFEYGDHEDFKKSVLDRINDYNFGGKNVK